VNGEPIGEGLDQVHLANQKGHSGIGFGTPIVFPEDFFRKSGQVWPGREASDMIKFS
jgi:hypothetical protein